MRPPASYQCSRSHLIQHDLILLVGRYLSKCDQQPNFWRRWLPYPGEYLHTQEKTRYFPIKVNQDFSLLSIPKSGRVYLAANPPGSSKPAPEKLCMTEEAVVNSIRTTKDCRAITPFFFQVLVLVLRDYHAARDSNSTLAAPHPPLSRRQDYVDKIDRSFLATSDYIATSPTYIDSQPEVPARRATTPSQWVFQLRSDGYRTSTLKSSRLWWRISRYRWKTERPFR